MKKVICFIVSIMLVLNISVIVVFSETISLTEDTNAQVDIEQKIYSNATISDDFADNRVIVVLKNQASLKFNDINVSDFPELGIKSIKKLSSATEDMLKYKIEHMINHESKDMICVAENYDFEPIALEIDKYHQILCLELNKNQKSEVLETIKKLENDENFLYVGPDYYYSIDESTVRLEGSELISEVATTTDVTINDTYGNRQWALDNIGLYEAWNYTTGSSSVTVGVIDTGISGSHPDLINNVNVSLCWDITSGSEVIGLTPVDTYGHGTHVAGIIGAQGNNNLGVSGACWNVELVSLRVCTGEKVSSSNVVAAIDYATEQSIPILNLSITFTQYDGALRSAIENYPGLFVCAAGNYKGNNDVDPIYPANIRLDNLISVGASNSSNNRWNDPVYGSNYGETTVDIFAPGASIYSTYIGNNYQYKSGTSMASPLVAGVAALLLSRDSTLSAIELKQILMTNVDDVDDGVTAFENDCISGGKLNAYKAITNITHPYYYTRINATKHRVRCETCSYYSEEYHVWRVVGNTSICKLCKYSPDSPPIIVSKPIITEPNAITFSIKVDTEFFGKKKLSIEL